MKHDEEIDKLFREASKAYFSEEIPEEFLTDINQRLDLLEQKKRRKPYAWWWISSVILLIAFGISYAAFQNHSNILRNKTTFLSAKKQTNEVRENKDLMDANKQKRQNNHNQLKSENTKLENSNVIIDNQIKINNGNLNLNSEEDLKFEVVNLTKEELNVHETKIEKENIEKAAVKEEIVSSESVNKQENDSIKSEEITSEIAKKNDDKSEVKNKNVKMEIGFYSGVSVINSSFKIPNDVANSVVGFNLDEYRQRREREEVATTSWDLALRYKLLVNNFSFQSGLDYFQWGEEIRYDYNSISGINRYSYLNIPLNLGYNFQINKFGMNPFVGASIGFGFKKDGRYLQPDLQTVSQVEAQKLIGNYQGGVEFSYLSQSNFKFSVTPLFRSSINEVVKSDVIHNKYVSFGLQIGFSYAW